MDVEILYVPGCPNRERARRHVVDALTSAHLTASLAETEVSTPDAARRRGMRGSPTILINGHDPFLQPASPEPSLSCRLYRVNDSADGAPSVDQLVEALRRAAA